MKLARTILALSFVLWAGNAQAWNGRGHMIVAAVAWSHLTPATQKRAAVLLKLNPFYAGWIKGVPAKDRAQVAFVIAATWPDLIKKFKGNCAKTLTPNKGPLAKYVYCNDGEEPTHAGAGQNIGYVDKLEHKYWHYIDMPFSTDGTATVEPKIPNAQTQISAFRTVIEDTSTTNAVESYDMVWLEHMVGDVHQPLHATSRFSAALPGGDTGANYVCTGTTPPTMKNGIPKCSSELHAFWDTLMGVQKSLAAPANSDAANANAAIAVAAGLTAAPPADASVADEATWIDESFQLARSSVYVDPPIGGGIGPYVLTDTYKTNAKDIAAKRVELAGERLANLLNDHLH